MTLKSSVVIFHSLESLQSAVSKTSTTSFHQVFFTDPDGWTISGTQMTNMDSFFWNGSSKFHFFCCRLLLEASLCYFLKNRLKKLRFLNFLKPLGTITQKNNWPFYPLEPFIFIQFTLIHPVDQLTMGSKSICCRILCCYRVSSYRFTKVIDAMYYKQLERGIGLEFLFLFLSCSPSLTLKLSLKSHQMTIFFVQKRSLSEIIII